MNTLLLFIGMALLGGCDSPSTASPEQSSPDDVSNSDSSNGDSTNGAWRHGHQFAFDGRTRTYSLYAAATGETRGLMVVLHGSGQTVENVISELAAEATAEANGLVIAVPAGIDNGWNDEDLPSGELADDVGFIDALVTELKTAYPNLPPHKIFAHGFSNGGGLATRLACESSQIRGIGVVGNYYVRITDTCQRPVGDIVPGWFGAGLEDEVVPVASVRDTMSSYVADLTDCTSMGSLESVEVPDLASGVVCKQFSNCNTAQLCEYANRGHEMLPGSFETAWRFLNAAVEPSGN